MQIKKCDCYVEDVNGKIVVLVGDEWDSTTTRSMKESFKRKGVDVLGVVILPDLHHWLIAREKTELIDDLKKVIGMLEAM